MSRQNPRGQRSIRLKHGRVDPAWFDLDVDNGEDVDVTIFGLTAEELRQLGQGCARAQPWPSWRSSSAVRPKMVTSTSSPLSTSRSNQAGSTRPCFSRIDR